MHKPICVHLRNLREQNLHTSILADHVGYLLPLNLMNAYKLDNKQMDADFLAGKPVRCNAIVPESSMLKEGDRLVVLLSNGKKYLGRIGVFNHTLANGYASGKVEITRSQKS